MISRQALLSSETEGKRARELFEALDDDGNGTLDEDEFVQVGGIFFAVFVTLLIFSGMSER